MTLTVSIIFRLPWQRFVEWLILNEFQWQRFIKWLKHKAIVLENAYYDLCREYISLYRSIMKGYIEI